jgi:hypothetical protein
MPLVAVLAGGLAGELVAVLAGVLVETGGGLVPVPPPCPCEPLPCAPALVDAPAGLEEAFDAPALFPPLFDAAPPAPPEPVAFPVDACPLPVTTLEGGGELPPVPVPSDDPQAIQNVAAVATTSNRLELMTALRVDAQAPL